MDLLELNDVYYRDRTRIEHDDFFEDKVRIECPFTPLEDPAFSAGSEQLIEAVVNNPFDGARIMKIKHSLLELCSILHNSTPVTDYFPYDSFASPSKYNLHDQRVETYRSFMDISYNCHPDIMLSDVIPGMTLVMDRVKNSNVAFSKDPYDMDTNKDAANSLRFDGRTLSLIYVEENGNKRCGYGTTIYTAEGLRSLPDELRLYLLSNVYLVGRSGNDMLPHDMHLKTSCVILYEDSIKKILDNLNRS